MTIKSFRKWSLFNSSSKDLFSKFSSCSTQNTDSTLFYEKLGIKKTNYTGNLKFALTPDLTDAKKYDELKVVTGGRKIFLAVELWFVQFRVEFFERVRLSLLARHLI